MLCNFLLRRINDLDEYDFKKARREGALNALESAVIDVRSKIEDGDFVSFAKADEAEVINTKSKEVILSNSKLFSEMK